jgi:hypothetical protein
MVVSFLKYLWESKINLKNCIGERWNWVNKMRWSGEWVENAENKDAFSEEWAFLHKAINENDDRGKINRTVLVTGTGHSQQNHRRDLFVVIIYK